MYVCICNAVTEKQVREAADNGVRNLWQLQSTLGVATNCGSCKDHAAEILREHRERQSPSDLRKFPAPKLYRPASV
ncbi:MAG: bacterioferritin-associated ferredoxin [Pseudomonadota bacterium]